MRFIYSWQRVVEGFPNISSAQLVRNTDLGERYNIGGQGKPWKQDRRSPPSMVSVPGEERPEMYFECHNNSGTNPGLVHRTIAIFTPVPHRRGHPGDRSHVPLAPIPAPGWPPPTSLSESARPPPIRISRPSRLSPSHSPTFLAAHRNRPANRISASQRSRMSLQPHGGRVNLRHRGASQATNRRSPPKGEVPVRGRSRCWCLRKTRLLAWLIGWICPRRTGSHGSRGCIPSVRSRLRACVKGNQIIVWADTHWYPYRVFRPRWC